MPLDINTLISLCLIASTISTALACACLIGTLRTGPIDYIPLIEMTGPELRAALRLFGFAFTLVAAIGAMWAILL